VSFKFPRTQYPANISQQLHLGRCHSQSKHSKPPIPHGHPLPRRSMGNARP
jgi:hypothetical protein